MERSKPPFSTPKVWLNSWERRRRSPILPDLFRFAWSKQFAVEVHSSDCQINRRCKWRQTCNFELSLPIFGSTLRAIQATILLVSCMFVIVDVCSLMSYTWLLILHRVWCEIWSQSPLFGLPNCRGVAVPTGD